MPPPLGSTGPGIPNGEQKKQQKKSLKSRPNVKAYIFLLFYARPQLCIEIQIFFSFFSFFKPNEVKNGLASSKNRKGLLLKL